ncbi:MAG: glycosyltransferase [Planctomycetes bacterium]|nr:glycosyltransferase [Planctomycetota bacterium]
MSQLTTSRSISAWAQAVRTHYNFCAPRRVEWLRKNSFFHSELCRFYKFLIPENSTVLELGCGTGDLIGNLVSSDAVGVDISEQMVEVARVKYPHVKFICEDIENFSIDRTFDYIIISGTLASVSNIQRLFQKITQMATPDTRIIVDQRNELWAPVLSLGERIGLKMPELYCNWLSIDDIDNFLEISNYQIIKRNFLLLLPVYIPILSTLMNKILSKLPIIRRFCLVQAVVARIAAPVQKPLELTCSVVLTCRDEEGNIEQLVERIPKMGMETEIIFVEGHSKDDTVGKIKSMMEKFPEKNIRLLHQNGQGKADAQRLGFDEARGDFICILEADLTTPPEEVELLWDAFVSGKGEYVTGSRFVYQMGKGSMSFFNLIGNRLFGIIFTLILEQRFTDTLCGLKGLSKKNYLRIKKQRDYFGNFDPFGDFELTFGAMKLGLKSVEIPVHYQPRLYGRSKAYGFTFMSFLRHAMLLLRMSAVAFVKFKFL